MAFLQKNQKIKNSESTKKPFYKRRWLKVLFLFLSIFLVVGISLVAYIFATGSKIFVKDSSFLKAITRDDSLQSDENGRTNILLIGRGGENHPGGLLTDTIMVVSIIPKEKKVAMISIPRDLYVPIQDHGKDKINTAFADGYNTYYDKNCKATKKKSVDSGCIDGALSAGANLTKETVSSIFDLPIHYYVMADFEGFKQLVDSIGGVDVYVEKAINDPFYPDKNMKGYEPFKLKAGQQHLSGEVALKYARSRETTSDFDRAARQQIILAAVKDKVMQLGYIGNPKKLIELVTILGNHLRTDFSPSEMKTLAEGSKDIDKNSILKKVLSSASDGLLISDSSSGTFYLRPKAGDFKQIQNFANHIFDQESSTKPENGNVEVLNGTSQAGLATAAANDLKEEGFTVSLIQTSKEKYKSTIIYDYTKGAKKNLVAALEKKFNVKSIQKDLPSSKSSVDITIIVGEDYKLGHSN